MNIVIRADASVEIGTGHIMRCLTLAEKLNKFGAKITFICRDLPGNSISYIRNQGMKVIILNEQMDNLTWNTKKIITSLDFEIDLLIIDHYEIDVEMEKILKPYVKKIMIIDDLANREHDCEILLDQNFYLNYNERYDKLVPAHCIKLLGPDYVLLRDEFIFAEKNMSERKSTLNNILLFFGGSDPTNETAKALLALQPIANQFYFNIHVVVGEANQNKGIIKEFCLNTPRTKFYCQVNNIAELMVQADLAIGAGGSTTWERCFLRLPSLTIVTAPNQLECTLAVDKVNATKYLGNSKNVDTQTISDYIYYFLENPNKLYEMSENCRLVINSIPTTTNVIVNEVLGANYNDSLREF